MKPNNIKIKYREQRNGQSKKFEAPVKYFALDSKLNMPEIVAV